MSEQGGGAARRRVRVTSPQTRIALARGHRPAQHLLPLPLPGSADEEALERSRRIFAAQRRLAARTLAALGLLLFGLSGLLGGVPALGRVTVAGVPLSWLLLLAGAYPLLLALAALHVRAAERRERPGGPGPRP
ncbi:hypothetical protein RM780_16710 [Streptomyces sp. DSM 44917]|uniref:Integral membrane protein n=1 Tax=Streptomyces boetiae TaxID=3075541 RepID=A0ABU2LBA2_9ACTN|nr:hypothetical protein [Streptomyces sp. DSM 44917]MDT0308587.1 hypothetical protein [Streptomyces sp. DSM 44917]